MPKKDTNKRMIHVVLQANIFERLLIAAHLTGRSKGDIIRETLSNWLEANEIPKSLEEIKPT